MRDPICNVCGEPKSAHVATDAGPLTHPREARGEGTYELVRPGYIQGGGAWLDDAHIAPTYRFVPTQEHKPSFFEQWSAVIATMGQR
jgi:hypothetical protein